MMTACGESFTHHGHWFKTERGKIIACDGVLRNWKKRK